AATSTRSLEVTSSGAARANGGTAYFRGINLGGAQGANVANIFFTTPPMLIGGGGAPGSTTISIIPWAWGSLTNNASANDAANNLVTYGATGIRPLNNSTAYVTNLTSGAASNVRLTTSVALSSARTINALVLAAGAGLTGTGTLTV